MSSAIRSIKIVKRKQRETDAKLKEVCGYGTKSDNQVRREIAGTIYSWIEERKNFSADGGLVLTLEVAADNPSQ